jgi:hypothetical protein
MIDPELIHLAEPNLTFGYNQKLTDPRDGITLFGPFSRDKITGQINIGIIGPKEQREFVINFLQRIHKPVFSNAPDLARPYFPGLQAAFGVHINFKSIQEINVERADIDIFLNYSDSYQRVYNLTELYSNKLKAYYEKESIPVTVWFVAIPDEIYQYVKPNSKIPSADTNIKLGLKKDDRDSNQFLLWDDMKSLKEAYNFEINFHNQLKAKLLSEKIVTQIIRESTIAYEYLWQDGKKKDYEKIFDSAKAWNISTTLYYKVGGIPWKLGEIRSNVCYLGLVYKKVDNTEDNRNACCAAQMFLDSGDGMVFRGNIGPWYNPETKQFHLHTKDAYELFSLSLESFKEKSLEDKYPDEVFVHAKTYFDEEEWIGFKEAAEGKCKIVGVRIRDDSNFKLYRDFSYCIPRGSALIVTSNLAYLWTKGFIPRIQTQLGLETPNPVSIEVVRGDKDILIVCKDILALTKLNYNACIFADGSPVTLRFADAIGEVLTAGKNIKGDILPFKHYV